DPQLTHAQARILVRLALHQNIENGRCDPSVEGLAAETNVARRTVQMALARGETLGWLTREVGGGRYRSRYRLTPGPRTAYAFEGQVIRLLPADFKRWAEAYRDLPDLITALQRMDDYYASQLPDGRKNWFYRASAWLAKDNAKYAKERLAIERERNSW